MDQDLRELFDLRWKERDRILGEEFLRVKNEMNARGVLHSSMTIQRAHKVMVNEFEAERKLISATIIDFVGNSQRVTSTSKFQGFVQDELANRKSALENLFLSAFTNIESELQTSSMTSHFVSLNDAFPLAQKELTIELNNAVVAYNKLFGSNLTDQLRNRFLNHPILAVVVLSVAGATFILSLLKMLGLVSFGQ
ncbi:hypothetical protein ORJ04_21815 [Rheinheimera baltica]|uniref:Uncharacterized protein n=1 Tax=Rheinheimera baltica TaxID=67576 RepID=A0ABT9I679_9GAMM|nr:hypothetical protein [Rheinheimera baltica]MDP5138588.1 hypothetical protein [Rheinheimera baltica]MDP5151259.1 hypothetical protein [Rheinheimera baltica]